MYKAIFFDIDDTIFDFEKYSRIKAYRYINSDLIKDCLILQHLKSFAKMNISQSELRGIL